MEINKSFNKLLIIDGSFLIHRALHQPALFELRAPDGKRSGGVFQFLRSVNSEMKKNPGYFPVVCFDAGLSKRRLNADPCYKHADERLPNQEVLTPEEIDNDYLSQYRIQRGKTIEVLAYSGIPSIRINGWEGDDLIYILSKMSKESLILTDDRDMLQLCSETVHVRRPMADELVTMEKLMSDNGYSSMYDFVKSKSITGDGSDNIPGCCKGVGGGTVINLINILNKSNGDMSLFESEESLKEFCTNNGIKFRKAFLNFNKDRYSINLELVDLSKVSDDVDEFILSSIIGSIKTGSGSTDYFALVNNLNNLGIKDVSVDELIRNTSARLQFLNIN